MSTTLTITCDELCTASLRVLGKVGEGEAPSAEDLINLRQALNLLFKAWADKGYKGFLYETITRAFVAAAPSYLLGPAAVPTTNRPQRVSAAWWTDVNNNKQTIFMVAKETFDRLTPRNQSGVAPTNAWYDAQLTNGIFNVWPVPDNANGTLFISAQKQFEDIPNGATTLQIPQPWFLAAKWALADEVGLEYRPHPDVLDRVQQKATKYLYDAANLEEEQESVMFKPSPFTGYYGRAR